MTTFSIDTSTLQEVGNNVLAGVKDDKLILVVDLKKPTHTSSTGRMELVASSGGFTRIGSEWKCNIMVGKPSR